MTRMNFKRKYINSHSTLLICGLLFVVAVSCQNHNNNRNVKGKEVSSQTSGEGRGIDGIDVSRYQKEINWKLVKQSLPQDAFVYIKCTEGATYHDPNYRSYAKGAKAQGLHVGGYHFFRMTSSAHAQFKNFKEALGIIGGDLIPMVDVERSDGKSRKELQDSLKVMLNLLEKEYGVKPMIYGTQSSYNSYCAPQFNSYPLYIGRYSSQAPQVTGPSHYTIWQYSDKGRVKGVTESVDLCKFHPSKSIKNILLPSR